MRRYHATTLTGGVNITLQPLSLIGIARDDQDVGRCLHRRNAGGSRALRKRDHIGMGERHIVTVIWRNDGVKGAYGGRSAEREFFGDSGENAAQTERREGRETWTARVRGVPKPRDDESHIQTVRGRRNS